ncbi:MAG: LD-carboxypeptidase [Bacteroidales bacterium]|nr:LD-carboxypeptidase [Bacteroidales bacterium]MDD4602879.1 LD-carboxypeptidase [Bacteroidales bacterium]
MIQPPYLKKGDKIGIVSPSRSITFEEIHPAIRYFQRQGLEIILGSYVFSKYNQFAGTDDQRRRDFQQMLDNPAIRAIICSRGGYGAVRILDQLDFTCFCKQPKWIVGYSDVTVFHAHINRQFGIETLHATMPINITSDFSSEAQETMMNALFGNGISYEYKKSSLSREGEAEGILVGGNLSLLYSLSGTKSEIETAGRILFLEDLDEYLYHIDRMMQNLKRTGKLSKLKGLIVGGMTKMNDNAIPFGWSANEIIFDAVKEFKYPVCFDFPAGHLDHNLALLLGRKAKLSVGQAVKLKFF